MTSSGFDRPLPRRRCLRLGLRGTLALGRGALWACEKDLLFEDPEDSLWIAQIVSGHIFRQMLPAVAPVYPARVLFNAGFHESGQITLATPSAELKDITIHCSLVVIEEDGVPSRPYRFQLKRRPHKTLPPPSDTFHIQKTLWM